MEGKDNHIYEFHFESSPLLSQEEQIKKYMLDHNLTDFRLIDWQFFNSVCLNNKDIGVIKWSVEDFESVAAEIEEGKGEIYDRNKFCKVLQIMINKHDAEIGINWDTISFYLKEYCLKID